MKPMFQPSLVNAPLGDPALYVDFLFERRALLFDLGELAALPPRKLLRISHVFVSHTHMDHFVGFDRLLRISVGRDTDLALFGPPGFIDRVEHKLAAYTWNLVDNYQYDFTLRVIEVDGEGRGRRAEFHTHQGFRREGEQALTFPDGVLLNEAQFRLRYTTLDHRIPSLAFALEERQHINVWKNRLEALGLPVGPWLQGLKQAVLAGAPVDTPVPLPDGRTLPLGELTAQLLKRVPGQKLVYVTDAAGHEANAERIIALAQGADLLFIETAFLHQDMAQAAAKQHLTARRAGELARLAGVKRVEPFHFSARYSERPEALRAELLAAFAPT